MSPHRYALSLLMLGTLIGALLSGCGRDAPDDGAPAALEVPGEVVAGEVVELPCAGPSLSPGASWQPVLDEAGEAVAGRFRPTRSGHHVWLCVERGRRGTLEVRPGAPAALSWAHLPDAVALGRSLEAQPHVLDAFGNRVPAALAGAPAISVEATPGEAVVRDDGRLRFVRPGTVVLRAQAAATGLTARHELLVDAGPPIVVLESPARGTIVRRTVTSGVRVAGRVIEDGPRVELVVDGRDVEVGPDGRFETLIVPHTTGLSVLRYRATDQVGQATAGARAVLFGPLRDPSEGLDTAARIFLPRPLLDDDDSRDLDDVASALELLLGHVKVPDQRLSFGCKGHVVLSRIRLDADDVDLAPSATGLDVGVVLSDVSVDISGQACACAFGRSAGCASASGSVRTRRVAAQVRTRIGTRSPTSVVAEAAHLDIAPLNIHWDFLWGGLDWAVELFEAEIREALVAAMREALTERVRANVQTVLDTLVPAQTLRLPPPFDAHVTLRTQLVAIAPSVHGLGFDVRTQAVSTTAALPGRSVPGQFSQRTVRASGEPPQLPTDRLGAALSLDIVNDAIYSLYARGALQEVVLDLEALGVPPGPGVPSRVTLSASLPPMLLPGRRAGSLQLVIGDLHVVAETPLETLELYVSLALEARVTLDEASHALRIELVRDGLEIHFEPASPHDVQSLSTSLQDTSSLVSAVVTQTLVGRQVRIGLPVMDLSLVPGIATERAGVLQLRDAHLTVSREGYLVVTGQVRQRAP